MLTQDSAALIVTGLWLLFAATHIGLAHSSLRRRMGGRRFTILFVVVAQFVFALLVLAHGALQRIGPWMFFHSTAYTTGVGVVSVIGLTFLVAGVLDYLDTPMVPLAQHTDRTALQRVTRHPTMLGLSLWGGAWAAMPMQLVDVAFFAGFPVLALLGSWHQDRKLARTRGASYASYLQSTSFVPFVAMLRQRDFSKGPWLLLAASASVAFAIHLYHDEVFSYFGAPFLLAFVVVSTSFTVIGLRRASASSAKSAQTLNLGS